MEEKIPEQSTGSRTDTLAEITLETESAAKAHFEKVKEKFLNINEWEIIAGTEKAEFSLRDANGELLVRKPQKGDFVAIKVPGLHNKSGEGFDWVQIEHLEEEKSEHTNGVYIRVRPTDNPRTDEEATAHFFDDKATSNFLIKRTGTTVSAEVHGRNEVPNTEQLSILEKVRNSLVAVGGMIAGSKFQWKSLTEGLIKDEA